MMTRNTIQENLPTGSKLDPFQLLKVNLRGYLHLDYGETRMVSATGEKSVFLSIINLLKKDICSLIGSRLKQRDMKVTGRTLKRSAV
jgi:hypothetical protein